MQSPTVFDSHVVAQQFNTSQARYLKCLTANTSGNLSNGKQPVQDHRTSSANHALT